MFRPLKNISLRIRITLTVALAATFCVLTTSTAAYLAIKQDLFTRIDASLISRVGELNNKNLFHPPQDIDSGGIYLRVVSAKGQVTNLETQKISMPTTPQVLALARGGGRAFFSNSSAAGVPVRVYNTPSSQPGYAVQAIRSLDETNRTLNNLLALLVLISTLGIAAVAIVGLLVARTILHAVHQLHTAIDHVNETGDLGKRVSDAPPGELGALAEHFNKMLQSLEDSASARERLISDASHELRTPLTSMRTNLEVLARNPDREDRERILDDVINQTTEIGGLMSDVINLARGVKPTFKPEPIRLDFLVKNAVERARRNYPQLTFEEELEENIILGSRSDLERAINNLLDNAGKWSFDGGIVEVSSHKGQVIIRDYGSGIAAEDLPHLFERFYRAAEARSRPGSGLGLAIVAQVVEAHGGSVSVSLPPSGGGSLFTLTLPSAE